MRVRTPALPVSRRRTVDALDGEQYTYGYNGFGQLASVVWEDDEEDEWENVYEYDMNGNMVTKTVKKNTSDQVVWTYVWDVQDCLIDGEKDDQIGSDDALVEYKYCP